MANGMPKMPDDDFLRKIASMFDLFHKGPGLKVTKGKLASDLRTNTRLIELAVFELRRRGSPILADGEGYWLAESPAEFEPVLRSLKHRLTQIHGTLQALESARAALVRQVEVEPNGQRRLAF